MESKTERWKELCALAAVEQDPERLLELVQEMNRIFEELDKQNEPPKGTVQ